MTLEVASPSELHVPGGSHISWIHASDKRRAERQDACRRARLHHAPYRDAMPFTSRSEWREGSPEGSQLEAVREGIFR